MERQREYLSVVKTDILNYNQKWSRSSPCTEGVCMQPPDVIGMCSGVDLPRHMYTTYYICHPLANASGVLTHCCSKYSDQSAEMHVRECSEAGHRLDVYIANMSEQNSLGSCFVNSTLCSGNCLSGNTH